MARIYIRHLSAGWHAQLGAYSLLPHWAEPQSHLLSPGPGLLDTHSLPKSILLSVVSTYLDDPAGMFSKVWQALQLAQGCDRAGQRLEHRGRSVEGQEPAVAAFKACGLCQHLQGLLQGEPFVRTGWVVSLAYPSSFDHLSPGWDGQSRECSQEPAWPQLREARIPWLTERLVLWCVRGVGRWQA